MNRLFLLLTIVQILFSCIAAIYFYKSLKEKSGTKSFHQLEFRKEQEQLKKMRSIHLTTPLSEQTRPKTLEDIIGQKEGIKALRTALCGPNPQHVLIYGPPGVGKTAAARLILEEAKKNILSPFGSKSRFVELDATTLRFDERSIADPLSGSVHDPIYQGAGAYGLAGIPQPKAGAVSEAHGGILFIDEIGELHPMQMNKLLKVLEDRIARFQSAYYSENNKNIPPHIHDIFCNGMPADFRLVGATTRSPEEIPPALRSRCMEIYFDGLKENSIVKIAENTIQNAGFEKAPALCKKISKYASNGRQTVNIIQSALSLAILEGRHIIQQKDLDWVLEAGRYQALPVKTIPKKQRAGVVNGLAVYGNDNRGILLTLEAYVQKAKNEKGTLTVTGIVEQELLKSRQGEVKRKSNAKASVENVITALEQITAIHMKEYDVHINFAGGIPVDGPSAGIAIFCAVYSALFRIKADNTIAMTGEISIYGDVLPVGGVCAKIEGAKEAGAKKVLIPADNWQEKYEDMDIVVKPVRTIDEVLEELFDIVKEQKDELPQREYVAANGILTAEKA